MLIVSDWVLSNLSKSKFNVVRHLGRPKAAQQFLRIKDVCKLTTLSPSYIYALQASGKFPKSHQLSPKISVWNKPDVERWMMEQTA